MSLRDLKYFIGHEYNFTQLQIAHLSMLAITDEPRPKEFSTIEGVRRTIYIAVPD
jgi:hypothetical protein